MAEAFAIKLPPLQWLRWLLHQYGWKKESWLHIFILYCLRRFSFLSTPSWSDTFRQSATRCALSFKLDVARWVCLLPRWRCATPFLQPLWPELMAHGGRRAGRRFSTGFNDNTSCRIDLRHPPEQQLGPCANPLNNGNVHWNNEPSSYWMVIFSHWWFWGGSIGDHFTENHRRWESPIEPPALRCTVPYEDITGAVNPAWLWSKSQRCSVVSVYVHVYIKLHTFGYLIIL